MRISIAIPTRERAEFLAASLRTCVAIKDPGIEIIVSDNASEDNTRAVVAGFNDPRIRYVHTGKRLSQRQNFENALNASSGEYVMMIGDDDAVLPGQFARLRAILEAQKPEALSWPSVFYQWPAAHKRAGGGMLRLRKELLFGNAFNRTREEQTRAICDLERTREDFSPKLYHGVLSREVIERLRAKTGEVIMGGQIDAYIATAALAVMERYLYIRHPFTVMAMGPKSGGSSVLEQFRPGAANDTLTRVVNEGESDPVIEAMNGPFPALGFYLLSGTEQAQRHLHQGAFPIRYDLYFEMILSQMQSVPVHAQEHGIAILQKLAGERGADVQAMLKAAIVQSGLPKVSASARIVQEPRFVAAIRQWGESRSYVTPSKVLLDVKGSALGAVDGATQAADHLIGSTAQVEITPDGAARAWTDMLSRAIPACMRANFAPKMLEPSLLPLG